LRGLGGEPFADQPRGSAGSLGKRRRGHRARRQQVLVETELVAEVNEHGIGECSEISQHAADKGIQFLGINVLGSFRHFVLLTCGLA
jgi:hypothetical protein